MAQKPTYQELLDRIASLERRLRACEASDADVPGRPAQMAAGVDGVPVAYQSLDALGRIGGWEVDIRSGRVFWTDNLYRLFGYDPGEISDLHQFFMEQIVHPIDRHRLEILYQEMISLKQPISAEFRVVCKDGEERMMLGEVVPEIDTSGEVTRVYGANLDITDHKEAQTGLRVEKEFTESILNAMEDIFILFDPEQEKVVRWNYAFKRMTGYGDHQVFEMDFVKTCIDPKDQDEVYGFLADVVAQGRAKADLYLLDAHGRRIPMEFSAAVVQDEIYGHQYIIAIGRDIRERKEAQEALEASHERFIKVLDSIDATVYVVDMETHEILFVNQNMVESFGRDMTGETCYQAYRNETDVCSHCPNDGLVDEAGNPTGVCVWQTKNPVTDRWYMNYDRAVRWTDGRLAKLQIATDITELKEMEDELRQAHKMESVGTLAGGVAHDFNNILGIIIGNAELAMDDIPEWNPARDYIQEIKTASLRAKDVVRQLLSFSRKTEIEQKPLDLIQVVAESLTLIRSSIPASIEIRHEMPESVPLVVADATQVHQVVINLCTNAAHAMDTAGGTIRVGIDHRILREEENGIGSGEYLVLTIRDSGQGLAPGVREKMFDPYFTTKAAGKGTGLGLSVVHGIVKSHHGHIRVESQPGRGTSIHVFFPVAGRDAQPSTLDETRSQKARGKGHILFVDDEEPIVRLAKRNLERFGYQVTARTSPETALSSFEAMPQAFDLVVTDMTMPRMSGLDLAEKLKSIRQEIPVILCTGLGAGVSKVRASQTQIDKLLIKPVSRADLAAEIDTLLEKLS